MGTIPAEAAFINRMTTRTQVHPRSGSSRRLISRPCAAGGCGASAPAAARPARRATAPGAEAIADPAELRSSGQQLLARELPHIIEQNEADSLGQNRDLTQPVPERDFEPLLRVGRCYRRQDHLPKECNTWKAVSP
jgi:hypothetical protein